MKISHIADVPLMEITHAREGIGKGRDAQSIVHGIAVSRRSLGEVAELEDVVRLEQRDAVVEVEALASSDLGELLVECAAAGDGCHAFPLSM